MPSESSSRTLGDYVEVLQRGKLVIIIMAVLVPVVAVLLTSFQKPVYEASAEVALQQDDLAATLLGVSGGAAGGQPERFTQTQARLARSPEIARMTLKAVGPSELDPQSFLRDSRVEPSLDADILNFVARASSEPSTVGLANAYARAYIKYANGQEKAAIARALSLMDQRLVELRAAGRSATTQYSDLQDRRQQLQTYSALNSASAVVTQPAEVAQKVSPRPLLAVIFGAFLGLILGVAFVFGREALNRPLRSPMEVAEAIGLPLLGRIPQDKSTDVVTLTNPNGADAEAYRLLCTSLDFVTKVRSRQAIVVTSAREGEGKSTVASNIAVTLARRGMNVILVDGDVIQPSLQSRFSLPARLGLTDIVESHARIDSALTQIQIDREPRAVGAKQPVRLLSEPPSTGNERSSGSSGRRARGQLHLLATKPVAPDTAELLLGDSAERLIAELSERATIVIIDSPPLLTSVGMAWAARADALLVVARLSEASRPIVGELGRALTQLPTAGLGVVVTGTSAWPGYIPNYGVTPTVAPAGRSAARS